MIFLDSFGAEQLDAWRGNRVELVRESVSKRSQGNRGRFRWSPGHSSRETSTCSKRGERVAGLAAVAAACCIERDQTNVLVPRSARPAAFLDKLATDIGKEGMYEVKLPNEEWLPAKLLRPQHYRPAGVGWIPPLCRRHHFVGRTAARPRGCRARDVRHAQ